MMGIVEKSRFERCVKAILEHEGGLSKHPKDPGGTTNWGVSLRLLKQIGLDINLDGHIDEFDVINLQRHQAEEIYYKWWWNRYGYNRIHAIDVCEKVFDLAVNMGSVQAHKLLQRALNHIARFSLVDDGIIGTKTLRACNSISHGLVVRQKLRLQAKQFYLDLIESKPELAVFKKGWLKRASW